jgi:hypothetical protein
VVGSLLTSYPDTNGTVYAMTALNGVLYIGGDFTTVGGSGRNRLAAINMATGQLMSWNPNSDDIVRSMTSLGNIVYAGGEFSNVSGTSRGGMAAIYADSGALSPWLADTDGSVLALAVSPTANKIFMGGNFTSVNSIGRNDLASVDISTAVVTSTFNPSPDSDINDIALSGNFIYLAGDFGSVASALRHRFAKLSISTGAITSWDPNANNTGLSVAVDGSNLYLGGAFTTIGGISRTRVAVVDSVLGSLQSFAPVVSATGFGARDILLDSDNVFIGLYNATITVNGVTRTQFIEISRSSLAPLRLNPSPTGGSQVVYTIYSDQTDGIVFIGGSFTTVNGVSRNNFAALINDVAPVTPTNTPTATPTATP